MQIEIPFGSGTVPAELPERTIVVEAGERRPLDPVHDLEETVAKALDAPLDTAPVETLVGPGARVTIAFDDLTVGSFGPVRQIVIDQLLERLSAAGVSKDDVTLICANSLHRKFRPHELAVVLGDRLVEEFGERLVCHDAEDPDALTDLGQTPSGHDVVVHRNVLESDLTIYVNAAHARGFNGGWKSICVGLSSYRSIRHHHTPDGMSMSLRNNRMHAMLDEMGRVVGQHVKQPIFKVDTVLANPLEVAHMVTGTVDATRRATLDVLTRSFADRREMTSEPLDVIVYGIPDWSPYAVFASMNPLLTLVSSGLGYLGGVVQAVGKPGCTVIMATPCPEVWDEVHHASYPIVWREVLSVTRDPYEIARRFGPRFATDGELIDRYRHGFAFHPIHAIMACYPLKRLEHVGQVIVAGIENPATARHLGFESASSVEEAVEQAERTHGPTCRIGYIRHPLAPRTN